MDMTLEAMKEFEEQALSVAFHPSGFHLVVGFADRIRMMNILVDDIIPFKDITIKNCHEISFSHGGDKFAVANNQNVHVYYFYTAENPGNMVYKEHSGRVTCIRWHQVMKSVLLLVSINL